MLINFIPKYICTAHTSCESLATERFDAVNVSKMSKMLLFAHMYYVFARFHQNVSES